MKVTKSYLKQLIKEELDALEEAPEETELPAVEVPKVSAATDPHGGALRNIADGLAQQQDVAIAHMQGTTDKELENVWHSVQYVMGQLESVVRSMDAPVTGELGE